jgi:hypothetical protein
MRAWVTIAISMAIGACASGRAVARDDGANRRGGRPDWVDGESRQYPQDTYMTGVGAGDGRQAAENVALAALSRVFRTEVEQTTRDFQRETTVGEGAAAQSVSTVDITQVTRASTAKVLEGARIVQAWTDPETARVHALAVLERAPAIRGVEGRLGEIDADVARLLAEADKAGALGAVRALAAAIGALHERAAFEAELRVLARGRGRPPAVAAAEVARRLRRVLAERLPVAIEVQGEGADVVHGALAEALTARGFVVAGAGEDGAAALRITGRMEVVPADVKDGKWTFVRWRAEFELKAADGASMGHVQEQGKEGHLSMSEAHARALRVLRDKVTADVGRRLADQVFGSEGVRQSSAHGAPANPIQPRMETTERR